MAAYNGDRRIPRNYCPKCHQPHARLVDGTYDCGCYTDPADHDDILLTHDQLGDAIDAALKRCVADKELSPAHEIAAETSRAQTEHLAEVLERVCFHKCPHAQSDACVGKACADCWQEYLVQALRDAAGGEE